MKIIKLKKNKKKKVWTFDEMNWILKPVKKIQNIKRKKKWALGVHEQ